MKRILPLLLLLMLFATAAFAEVLVNDPTLHAQSRPAIVQDGTNIYIVYQDTSTIDYDVRFAASTNGGQSFEQSILVHPESDEDQWQPHLAVAPSGTVYVVWADYTNGTDFDVYLAATTDGQTFSAPIRVNDITQGTQVAPRLAINPAGDIFVVWNDNRATTGEDQGVRWDVYVARSSDDGQSFEPSVQLSGEEYEDEPYFAWNADIVAPGDYVHLVYYKCNWSAGSQRIRYSFSDDDGDTYSAAVTLDSGSWYRSPKIDGDDSGRLTVVWEDARNSAAGADPNLVFGSGRTLDAYATWSADYGQSWSAAFRVNEEIMLNQQRPAVCLTTDGWAVVWSDDRNVGEYTIRLAKESWPPSGLPLVGTKIDSYEGVVERTYPAIDASNDTPIVVWQDYRDDNYDIYFATGEAGR